MAVMEYFEALERLKKGKPDRVPKNTKITNSSVALEAGKTVGSIKKTRGVFDQLIEAIQEAAAKQVKPKNEAKERHEKTKAKVEKYRSLYEEAVGREIMLIRQVYQLETELNKLKASKVVRLNAKKEKAHA